MQPLSGNQHPDLLTSLMNMSLVLRLPRDIHLSRSPHRFWKLLTFGKVQDPSRLPRKTTSEPSKVVRACGVF